ncbi:MAG: hypothetical protein JST12_14350 [Armatimonadetes bacterium]|nr:hypothetical protein [Armatimonadota bacterium]
MRKLTSDPDRMSYCYVCGKPIRATQRHIRRKVKTGQHETRAYLRGSAGSVSTYYGMRLVCRSCANRIDRLGLRRELVHHFGPLLAMLALLLLARFLFSGI